MPRKTDEGVLKEFHEHGRKAAAAEMLFLPAFTFHFPGTFSLKRHLHGKILDAFRAGYESVEDDVKLETAEDLINHLETLGRKRILIYDAEGNTDDVYTSDIAIWDEHDPESPIAFFERTEGWRTL